ncbi:hypothetical protein DID77_02445 [Candidatus Marinamargulisbacteria bacterium SCGC AG-439-L15]|nr:hypothetical protein DID77_02445 [Candidatus Marinamargulisbacteria bacterium SCGC AG-439-L15]
MTFANTSLLWILLTVPLMLACGYHFQKWRANQTKKIVASTLWGRLIPASLRHRRSVKGGLIFLGVFLLIISILRPQFGFNPLSQTRPDFQILIALDTSLSMLTEDVSQNRFEQAKKVSQELISKLPGHDIGLIGFSKYATLYAPPTKDTSALMLYLQEIYPGNTNSFGTDISSVVTLANTVFKQTHHKHRFLVILSDGETINTKYTSTGIPIITVGIGSLKGAPIPIRSKTGHLSDYIRDELGQIVVSKPNSLYLKTLSQNKGSFIQHKTISETVYTLHKWFHDKETQLLTQHLSQHRQDRYSLFLFLAILVLIWELFLPLRTNVRYEAILASILCLCLLTYSLVSTQKPATKNPKMSTTITDLPSKNIDTTIPLVELLSQLKTINTKEITVRQSRQKHLHNWEVLAW